MLIFCSAYEEIGIHMWVFGIQILPFLNWNLLLNIFYFMYTYQITFYYYFYFLVVHKRIHDENNNIKGYWIWMFLFVPVILKCCCDVFTIIVYVRSLIITFIYSSFCSFFPVTVTHSVVVVWEYFWVWLNIMYLNKLTQRENKKK